MTKSRLVSVRLLIGRKGGVSFLDQSQSKDEQNHGSPDCFRKLIENGSIGMIHVFKNCEFRKKLTFKIDHF